MKMMMKKTVAFVLTFSIMLGVFLFLGISSGVSRTFAAGYTGELWMLTGRTDALIKGTRRQISDVCPTASAYAYQGETMTFYAPISALCKYRNGWSWSINGNTVTVTAKDGTKRTMTIGSLAWSGGTFLLPPVLKDGEVYLSSLSLQAVFSVKSFFNQDIGLIVISASAIDYNQSYSSLKTQIETLRHYLFDDVTGDGIYADVVNTVGINTHPRMMVTQDRFDELRAKYLYYQNPAHAGEASMDRLFAMTAKFVAQADSYFTAAFTEEYDVTGRPSYRWRSQDQIDAVRQPYYLYDEDGNRLVGETEYVNRAGETIRITDVYGVSPLYGDGYDQGGRSNVSAFSDQLQYYAFAWQITRDDKYAFAFYSLAHELGKWEHWGEGHFLNCADGAAPYALGLDWIWHAYDNDTAKRDEIARILYEKSVEITYYCITDKKNTQGHMHRSTIQGQKWGVTEWKNNWNTVCTSGIVMAALTLLDYDEYAEHAKFTMEKQIGAIYKCLIQYAPDGAYIESPGYWAYGTNTYMRMLACLQSATGKTYGYLDTIGLQQSYYFANNIADADFLIWNYHDGGRTRVDATTFYMAAALYNDPMMARLRDLQLERYPTDYTLYDPLFYSPDFSAEVEELPALDDYFKGIETAVMHSAWESGATFAGLHVGANKVAHGDMDCGTFYLEMGGILWFGDSGAENYNIGNYFNDSYRYYFYRKSAESHNTILIRPQAGDTSSDIYKYGQVLNDQSSSYATITSFVSNENGSYAIANMTPQYGPTCSAAKRGLLLTNSRSTVVVQDEISFSSPTSLIWTAAMRTANCEISPDGRTAIVRAYGAGGAPVDLRASIVSDDPNLRFSLKRSGVILPNTITTTTNNGTPDNRLYPAASAADPRLLIEANNVSNFNCAVVFEIIRRGGSREPTVGYSYTDMQNWQTTTNDWLVEADADIVYKADIRYKYDPADLMMLLSKLEAASSKNDYAQMRRLLAGVTDLPDNINIEDMIVVANLPRYMQYLNVTNAYVRDVNYGFALLFGMAAGAI